MPKGAIMRPELTQEGDARHDSPSRRDVIKTSMSAGLLASVGTLRQSAGAESRKPHVVILGAGLAGLCAAYQLQQQGCTYTILEAEKEHVGGRVRTHRFGDGTYGELGAMRIPKPHTTVLRYVDAFGLRRRPFYGSHENAFYYG